MTYPVGHTPRYEKIKLKDFLDETLCEDVERFLFTVDDNGKYELTNKLVEAGIGDIIIGSGPQAPQLLFKCLDKSFAKINEKLLEFYSTNVMRAVEILDVLSLESSTT